ncbi:butyrophilin subfamily 1 member A1-like [Emydura macquarii macquarii]|uniref:butyrophilin subfamily 1 member A1-like n=1 Tax=Emydura macquarii macquarii TaxID=1129001 RepID=UPI00352AABC2
MSAESMELRWFRSQFSAVVHLYRDGQDLYGEQMPEYQGRTELLKDNITNGSVSLRIRDIRPSDDGQYTCFFQSGVSYEEALLELQVAGLGSAPAISVEGHQDGGIRVVCRSSGWFPEPEVLWRDLQGQLLPSASEKISQEANGLFQTEAAIVLTEESNQKVSCCVRNPRLNQERQSEISIAELFFPRVSPGMVALGVILALLSVLIALASYYTWRQHRAKETLRSELENEKAAHRAEKANVTLDPDTAHPDLILSADGKSVRWADTRQDLPNYPERFDTEPCVLGCEGFTSGRHYWEVEVGDGRCWAVGLARESVRRKGGIRLCPEEGIWAVEQWLGQFQALTSPPIPLLLSRFPCRIQVCLDCDRGQVTFFDAGDETPIFTVPPASFPSGRIRPWLWVGVGSRLRLCS